MHVCSNFHHTQRFNAGTDGACPSKAYSLSTGLSGLELKKSAEEANGDTKSLWTSSTDPSC